MKSFSALAICLILGGLSPAAWSAQAPTPTKSPSVDPVLCSRLVKHTPDADVAYQPGLDVHGKPVVPADLDGGSAFALPDEIEIPLSADLFHFLNVNQANFPFNTMARNDINLGKLTLRGDRVYMNGTPLSDADQDRLAVLCLKPTGRP